MSTEQRQAIKARWEASLQPPWYVYEGNASDDVGALLADVDRLTGDNAALSEALDTALAHLKESEADRDKAIAELASYKRNAAYVAACVDSDGCYRP
jgi:hypothetical protein